MNQKDSRLRSSQSTKAHSLERLCACACVYVCAKLTEINFIMPEQNLDAVF